MWKLRIGIALLVGVNLAIHGGVTIALRYVAPAPNSLIYSQLHQTSHVLNATQFAAALFCMTYTRFATPWRQVWCTFWMASAELLHELRPDAEKSLFYWEMLFTLTTFWTGHALFVLGRWYFGTELDRVGSVPAKRRSLLSVSTLASWSILLSQVVLCNVLLSYFNRPELIEGMPLWSTALGVAILYALYMFPVFLVLLTCRHTWILFTALSLLIVVFFGLVNIAQNPNLPIISAFGLLLELAILFAALAFNPLALRFMGFRWQEAESWPVPARLAVEPAPNPFE